jgi:hypothetical protein
MGDPTLTENREVVSGREYLTLQLGPRGVRAIEEDDKERLRAVYDVLASARATWRTKYPTGLPFSPYDVAAVERARQGEQARATAEMARRSAERDNRVAQERAVESTAIENALRQRPSFRMPPQTGWPGLSPGSVWTGNIDAQAAELTIRSPMVAVMSYGGVKETLLLEMAADGEILLAGVAHNGPAAFSLDTFRGLLSADSRSITGTWKDERGASGQWSITRR